VVEGPARLQRNDTGMSKFLRFESSGNTLGFHYGEDGCCAARAGDVGDIDDIVTLFKQILRCGIGAT
jgi:hypothetical protein